MKMYILVKESIPMGPALVAAAHASLAAYLKFQNRPEIAKNGPSRFSSSDCTDELPAGRENLPVDIRE